MAFRIVLGEADQHADASHPRDHDVASARQDLLTGFFQPEPL
jgi:hypothetical protein